VTDKDDQSGPYIKEKQSKFSLRRIKTFSSLKYPTFRLYYIALLSQRAAFNMHMVARSYLIYEITGSPAILGWMSLAHAVPMILTSLYGGALADRLPKKYIMMAGQTNSAIVSVGIAIALTMGYLGVENAGSWWILLAAAVLDGTFTGIMVPSRHSVVPEIVGKESVTNAIALNNLAMSALQLLGPAMAGFLVDAFDYNVVYFIMAGLSLVAVLFIALMPLTGKVVKTGMSALSNIKEGLRYVKQNRTLLFVLIFVLVSILLSRPIHVLLPIFSKDILDVGIKGMGILLSVAGAGAIIGSIGIASMPNKKRGLVLVLGCLALGIALIGFANSTSWRLSLAMMFIIGLGQAVRMTMGNVLAQHYTEDSYRGRVMSIYTLEFGLTSFGMFAAGLLADVFTAQWVLTGFATALILITILVLTNVPRLRKLD
jgi:MFS family permease